MRNGMLSWSNFSVCFVCHFFACFHLSEARNSMARKRRGNRGNSASAGIDEAGDFFSDKKDIPPGLEGTESENEDEDEEEGEEEISTGLTKRTRSKRVRSRLEGEEEVEEQEEEDAEACRTKLVSLPRGELAGMYISIVKKLKTAEEANDNQKKAFERMGRKYNETRLQAEELQKQLQGMDEGSSMTATCAGAKEVVALELTFTDDQRSNLRSIIRTTIFKKHKITTAMSFDSGEIQRTLMAAVGPEYMTDVAMAAHRNDLVKLVNKELTQKRNHVNGKILQKWIGEYKMR